MALEDILQFSGQMAVADIGAAAIAEPPPYKALIDRGLAMLSAFDADQRHHATISETYGAEVTIFPQIIGDGAPGMLHLAGAATGMSSLLEPSPEHLGFFNGFPSFGAVYEAVPVPTVRLDDVPGLPSIDYLKMDIQGAELAAMKGGSNRLQNCVAVQLEVSFVPLYRGQPGFGEVDVWMRAQGFLPHTFTQVKRWSVSPTIRADDFRYPFNQLLEGDIVYFRDLIDGEARLSNVQLQHLALVAHYAYRSPDIVARILRTLAQRRVLPGTAIFDYLKVWRAETKEDISLL
jgi:FkbM family methyltransferase